MFFLLAIPIYFFTMVAVKRGLGRADVTTGCSSYYQFPFTFFRNGCSKKEDWVEQVLQLDVLPIINFHLLFSQWLQ